MKNSLSLSFVWLLSLACGSSEHPSEPLPDAIVVENFAVNAHAELKSDSLHVISTFTNQTPTDQELMISGSCPFFIALIGKSGRVGWQEDGYCLGVGTLLEAGPGEEKMVSRALPVDSLPVGTWTITVRVLAGSLSPPVTAGEVSITR